MVGRRLHGLRPAGRLGHRHRRPGGPGLHQHIDGGPANGSLWQVNTTTGVKTEIATDSSGSFGDFISVDPNNGTLLVPENEGIFPRVEPPGRRRCGFGDRRPGTVLARHDRAPPPRWAWAPGGVRRRRRAVA